jgi:hypothetical protein
MEFITHLPTTIVFVTNMAFLVFAAIALAGLVNLIALLVPASQDLTWEKHVLGLDIEVEPEVEPVPEFAFSEAALAVFEEISDLAKEKVEKVSPPPHLPEALKGATTLALPKPIRARWRPVRRRRPEHYQAR